MRATARVDGGLQQVAEELVGVEPPEHRAEQEPGAQQQRGCSGAAAATPATDAADADDGDQRQRRESVTVAGRTQSPSGSQALVELVAALRPTPRR